jgi:hypothetical protein
MGADLMLFLLGVIVLLCMFANTPGGRAPRTTGKPR